MGQLLGVFHHLTVFDELGVDVDHVEDADVEVVEHHRGVEDAVAEVFDGEAQADLPVGLEGDAD